MDNTEGKTILYKSKKGIISSKKKDVSWLINEMGEHNITDIIVSGEFINASTNVTFKCCKCGNEWSTNPHHVISGSGCPVCAKNKINYKNNKRKTHEEFEEEIGKINQNITFMGRYKNAHTPIKTMCNKCGNIWYPRPTNLRHGCGCPECSIEVIKYKQRKTTEEFVNEMSTVNESVEVLSEYCGNKSKVKCRCRKCGHEWSAMPINLLRGTACPSCCSSKGEIKISEYLESNGIVYQFQKRFEDLCGVGGNPMPYDFYIESINTLIEYQGEFHDRKDRLQTDKEFEVRKIHDRIKREYALNNGFTYLEIWYYDDIEEKLNALLYNIDPVTTTAV